MATTRLIPMHKIKNQSIAYTVHKRINYAINPAKTLGGELVMTYGCDPATAANEMLLTKRAYADFTGREIPDSDVLLYQIRQSFKPGEVTPEQAQQIGYELAMSWTKGKHQFVVATHIDHAHIHTHIIYNAAKIDARHKYRNFLGSSFAGQIEALDHWIGGPVTASVWKTVFLSLRSQSPAGRTMASGWGIKRSCPFRISSGWRLMRPWQRSRRTMMPF